MSLSYLLICFLISALGKCFKFEPTLHMEIGVPTLERISEYDHETDHVTSPG